MLFIAFLLISAQANQSFLSAQEEVQEEQGKDYVAMAEFMIVKAIFGEENAAGVLNKLHACNKINYPVTYKTALVDYFKDLSFAQHICYRTNNYEIQRKIWVSSLDHFQKLFELCDLDMEADMMQNEYPTLIATTDRLNGYLNKAHAAYMKWTEDLDHAIFGTPADNYAVNDSPELRQLDSVEDHLYNVSGGWLMQVQNGLQERQRRYNMDMSKKNAETMKKEIKEQTVEDFVQFTEFLARYIDEVCWRNVYIMNGSNRINSRIDDVVRKLNTVISDNDYS